MSIMKSKAENLDSPKPKVKKKKSMKASREIKKKPLDCTASQITRYFIKTNIKTINGKICSQNLSDQVNPVNKIESACKEIIEIQPKFERATKGNIVNTKVDNKQFSIFPFQSHVRQNCSINTYWSSPRNILQLRQNITEEFKIEEFSINIKKTENVAMEYVSISVANVKSMKSALNEMKNNSNFPVNRVFKNLCTKSGKNFSTRKSVNSINNPFDFLMWTEKYKPVEAEDIIGQTKIVNELKKWLQTWDKVKKTDDSSCSEAEFDVGDSRSSMETSLENTIILEGPNGCGKSSIVYAVCKEIGYGVLEINASSTRTGKKLMQELREATQSYQVNKNEDCALISKKSAKNQEENSLKVCVIFIEDIDVVFDEDDGFLSSVIQLTTTAKCPIILSTTDKNSCFVQQFVNQSNCRVLAQTYPQHISNWMQIVCLVEGFVWQENELNMLLRYNSGDVRRSLIELQYWVESECEQSVTNTNVKQTSLENKQPQKCRNSLLDCKRRNLIFDGDLGFIWWNMLNVFPALKESSSVQRDLKRFDDVWNYLCILDVCSTKTNSIIREPVTKHWSAKFLDSLQLKEDQSSNHSVLYKDLFQVLIEKYTNEGSFDGSSELLPSSVDITWRNNVHKSVRALEECIELTNYMDRRAIALDYLPALRNIARSEQSRFENNNKRRNRFRHYFRELSSVHCNDDLYKSVCGLMGDFK